jgi:hypothetical protein
MSSFLFNEWSLYISPHSSMFIPIVSIKTHILDKEINTKHIKKKIHCHNIAEILLMLALNINQSIIYFFQLYYDTFTTENCY